jgi:hypothetical protein
VVVGIGLGELIDRGLGALAVIIPQVGQVKIAVAAQGQILPIVNRNIQSELSH